MLLLHLLALHVDGEDSQAFVAVLSAELFEISQLDQGSRAPGGPEQDDSGPAALFFPEGVFLPVKAFQGNGRGLVTHLQVPESRSRAGNGQGQQAKEGEDESFVSENPAKPISIHKDPNRK